MRPLKELIQDKERLENEYEKITDRLSELAQELRGVNKDIKEYQENKVKYNGKSYSIVYTKIKGYRSMLQKINDKEYKILINSRLSEKERQEELHIILKEKECLAWYVPKVKSSN